MQIERYLTDLNEIQFGFSFSICIIHLLNSFEFNSNLSNILMNQFYSIMEKHIQKTEKKRHEDIP